MHPIPLQRPGRRPPHIQQVGDRQWPDDVLKILRGNQGGGVGLLIVAAQLGENLIEGHAHGDGQAQLSAHLAPDAVGQGYTVPAEQMESACHVQPALINAKGLHQISKPFIQGVDSLGHSPIFVMVGGQQHQVRAFLPGLPDGFRRLDPKSLGPLVFCQDNAVAALGIAAHRHRLILEFWVFEQFHRSVKAVTITVKDHTVHLKDSFPAPQTLTYFPVKHSTGQSRCQTSVPCPARFSSPAESWHSVRIRPPKHIMFQKKSQRSLPFGSLFIPARLRLRPAHSPNPQSIPLTR